MATSSLRRAFLGDWNRFVRDPLDVLRLVFFAATVWAALQGDTKAAFNMALATVVVVIARFAYLPRLYDLALIAALSLT